MGGYPDLSLTGRTALVTGSVRGLGLDALAPGDLARLLDVHLVSAYALSSSPGARAGSTCSGRPNGSMSTATRCSTA